MNTLEHPIVRISSHAGIDYPVAILTHSFLDRSGEARVQMLDCEKNAEFSAPLDWVRLHTRPVYSSSGPSRVELDEQASQVLSARGYDSPEFDRGASEPMRSWSEKNAQRS